MNDATVHRLAVDAGIAVDWTDLAGKRRRVAIDVLRSILAALGLPCDSDADLRQSLETVRSPPVARSENLIVVTVGEPIAIPGMDERATTPVRVTYEDGTCADVRTYRSSESQPLLPPIMVPGYHKVEFGERVINLALAPKRCQTIADLAPDSRLWGLVAQLYGLRRRGDGGIGDVTSAGLLARSAARHGADAVALTPAHALFAADPARYTPYSPSSRLFLNPLHADPAAVLGPQALAKAIEASGLQAELVRLESAPLIDWPSAAGAKFTLLRRLFEDIMDGQAAERSDARARDFADFRAAGGDLLRLHAVFEALQADRLAADSTAFSWRNWPAPLRNPASAEVKEFASRQSRDVLFHCFLQWMATRSFAAAQREARNAGMRIGLIGDLAVGVDSGGSHAWSRQADFLVGLEIGAPPDMFNPLGQKWGLTHFSPRALVAAGFAPFIATLRTNMRNVGGLRIDHAMGLARLWLIPEGARPDDGAYLTYPLDDCLRLIALESRRNNAIVIGEDLGTVPYGFRERITHAGIAGMRVLWFERESGRFSPPQTWSDSALAMTTTHDLPTVAGWWRGADIELRDQLALLGEPSDRARSRRDADRTAIWRAFCDAGTATGPEPAIDCTDEVIDAAVGFIARTPAPLAVIPLEDALGMTEQPNVPGTIDQHPNWRRRMGHQVEDVLDLPAVDARLAVMDRNRKQ